MEAEGVTTLLLSRPVFHDWRGIFPTLRWARNVEGSEGKNQSLHFHLLEKMPSIFQARLEEARGKPPFLSPPSHFDTYV